MDTLVEANYVILTREQFANDYPAYIEDASNEYNHVLVLHADDDALIIAALWGSVTDFATFTSELAEYAAGVADPGTVQPKVGANHTELAGR